MTNSHLVKPFFFFFFFKADKLYFEFLHTGALSGTIPDFSRVPDTSDTKIYHTTTLANDKSSNLTLLHSNKVKGKQLETKKYLK